MPYLTLIRLTSRLKPVNTNGNLAFFLPSLSTTETAYIKNSLEICEVEANTFCSTRILEKKMSALTEAYGVSKDKQDPENINFMKLVLASRSLWNNFPYSCVSAHLLSGIEFGAIMGDLKLFLATSARKRLRSKPERTVKELSKEAYVQEAYRNRLLEVLEDLDLDSELLLNDHDFDKDGFSPTFYEKLMSEYCGVTPPKKTINSRHKKFLTMNYDPINIARTYYILKEILDLNLDMNINHVGIIGRVNAVQLILTLNVLYSLTDKNLSCEERKEKVVQCADNFVDKFIDDQLIWHHTLPQVVNILKAFGFTDDEVTRLMFETPGVNPLAEVCHVNAEYESTKILIDVMGKRMALLRQESAKLSLGETKDLFQFLLNFDQVVQHLNEAELRDNPCYINFKNQYTKRSSLQFKIVPLGSRTGGLRKLPAVRFLFQYFNYSRNDKEKRTELVKGFSRIRHARDVPLNIIIDSANFLESYGFTNQQIEKGFPILFYDNKILKEKIEDASAGMGQDWMEQDNALCLLNYLIETECNFSFTKIYTGILQNFQSGVNIDALTKLRTNQS